MDLVNALGQYRLHMASMYVFMTYGSNGFCSSNGSFGLNFLGNVNLGFNMRSNQFGFEQFQLQFWVGFCLLHQHDTDDLNKQMKQTKR